MSAIPSADSVAFRDYRSQLLGPASVEAMAQELAMAQQQVADRLSMAVAEAAQTLRVLEGVTVPESGRVLEVGAGLGVASSFLSLSGFHVTALEPAGSGFEEHELMAPVVRRLTGSTHDVLDIGAELLDPHVHGQFDLVFSNNVIERVPDLEGVFRALASVTTLDGRMVHSCPNYSIPFEPHFGLPLVPLRPELTTRVLPASIRDSGLWRSLNFVRARDVERLASELGFEVVFEPGLLAKSLDRLSEDDEFRSRHRQIARVASLLSSVGLIALIRRLPPKLSTLMNFTLLPATSTAAGS